jgi:hypothetical protein
MLFAVLGGFAGVNLHSLKDAPFLYLVFQPVNQPAVATHLPIIIP